MTEPDLAWLDATLDPPQCECVCHHGAEFTATTCVVHHDCELDPPRRSALLCEPCQQVFVRSIAWKIHHVTTAGGVYACRECGLHLHSVADFILEVSSL